MHLNARAAYITKNLYIIRGKNVSHIAQQLQPHKL